jgi:hypothetical protein
MRISTATLFGAYLLRRPDVDFVRVQDVGLAGQDDEDVLAWAAQHSRIVVTQDRASMPQYAYNRLAVGETMPGVFVFHDRIPAGDAIREILLLISCSEQPEWVAA